MTQAATKKKVPQHQPKKDFLSKVDGIVSLIQSRKRWLEVRSLECDRISKLIKKDHSTVEWLLLYLQEHLEKQGIKKLRTNKFNLSNEIGRNK